MCFPTISDAVQAVFDESKRTGVSVLTIPDGWTVSAPVYTVAMDRLECPGTLQADVQRALTSISDEELAEVTGGVFSFAASMAS
jgi:hypothetical protein